MILEPFPGMKVVDLTLMPGVIESVRSDGTFDVRSTWIHPTEGELLLRQQPRHWQPAEVLSTLSPEMRYACDPDYGTEEFLDAIAAGPAPLVLDGMDLTPRDAMTIHGAREFLRLMGRPPRTIETIYCVGCYEEAKYDAGNGATSCLCNHTWVLPDGLIEVSSFRHMGLSPMTREQYIQWARNPAPSSESGEER